MRDLGERVAENTLVLEADVGDHRNLRGDDVGGIEPAPKPDFEDDDVAARVPVRFEREERRVFEERKRGQTGIGTQLLDALRSFCLRNWPTRDAHTLDVSLQVRRGELPSPVARRSQHGLDHRCNAALPVRPRDVDEAQRVFRVSANFGRRGNPIEPELDAARLQAVEPAKRFGVSHHPDRYSIRRATLARMS